MLSATRVANLYLRQAGKIDTRWVDQVREAWKHHTRIPTLGDYTDSLDFLQNLIDFVDALAEDILFNKAFYTLPGEGPRSIPQRLKDKVIAEMRVVREILVEVKRTIESSARAMDPDSREYQMENGFTRQFYEKRDPRSPMRAFGQGSKERVVEAVKEADKVFSRRMLAAITRYMSQYNQSEIDFGQIDLKFQVGNMSVVYQDFPSARAGGGPLTTVPTRAEGTRFPQPEEYAKLLQTSKALLEQKGLGFLWYGDLYIRCKSCGGENSHGAHFGVGAHYFINTDHVQVYSDPHRRLPALIIHELGHRYYYKFMSQADRAKFDSYFAGSGATPEAVVNILSKYEDRMSPEHLGMFNQVAVVKKLDTLQFLVRMYFDQMKPQDQEVIQGWVRGVPATSTYGQTTSSEDFAEVFSGYVMGEDLTRDQVERFKAFLGRTQRSAARVAQAYLQAIDLVYKQVQPS